MATAVHHRSSKATEPRHSRATGKEDTVVLHHSSMDTPNRRMGSSRQEVMGGEEVATRRNKVGTGAEQDIPGSNSTRASKGVRIRDNNSRAVMERHRRRRGIELLSDLRRGRGGFGGRLERDGMQIGRTEDGR